MKSKNGILKNLPLILTAGFVLTCNPGLHENLMKVNLTGAVTMSESFSEGPVVNDPFSEGINNFSMMMAYKNRIYIGPANSDNAFFRIKPDGTEPETVSLIFNGNPGTTTTLNPGPDSEDGIDYFISGTIGGTEYLFIGPSRSAGSLDYIYYTTDTGDTLDFYYINLSNVLGPLTKGVSAMHIFNDQLYISFPDTSGSRPFLIKLKNILQTPAAGIDFFNLRAKNMPVVGNVDNTAGIIGLESMTDYNDNIYIADGGNNAVGEDGGIYKSTNNDPGDYDNYSSHWEDATPANAEWGARFSNELQDTNKLTPSEKAFPAMTVFNGSLYITRNTSGSGAPQLWKYNGSVWTLVAGNGSGITNMSNLNNQHITLLSVNGDRLYIGFNNSEGVQIWRTKNAVGDPALESDFESVTSDGMGDSANNREIFHSLSVSDAGVDYLWLLCGIKGGALRVYRTEN